MKELFWIPVLGLSATPMRPDLGQHFQSLVRGPSVEQLMNPGIWSGLSMPMRRIRCHAPDTG